MEEILNSPAALAIATFANVSWQFMITLATGLLKLGLVFWLLTMVLKRWPFGGPNRHNLRLAHEERPFFNKEFLTELALPMFGPILLLPLAAMRDYLIYEGIVERYLPYQIFADTIASWPHFVQVVVALLIIDLTLFLRHWFVHIYCWPYHTIHHAAREITWLTFLRLHPGDQLVMGTLAGVVLHTFGFGGEAFAFATLIYLHFNKFNHSNIQLDYPGFLRYVFVSPNMHRWHHAADDPKAVNKNFCIVFSFIDLAFGTFYVPKNRLPTRYGVIDAEGNDVAAPDFVSQLLYPFREHARWIDKRLNRTAPED